MDAENVHLLAYQEPNVERILEIFAKHKHAIDTSPLGAGKMYMATYIARKMEFQHVIVVSPKSTLPKWQTMKTTFGLPVADGHFMTYAALRGAAPNGVIKSHGLLTAETIQVNRQDEGEEPQEHDQEEGGEDGKVRTMRLYHPTMRLTTMATEGCILILDEFQHVKNPSSQQKAAAAIIACLNRFPETCKTLLLSGSPIDKATQIITLYRTLGIADKGELYAKNRYLNRILWRRGAFYEVFQYHAKLDASATIQVVNDYYDEEGRLPYDFVDAMLRDIQRAQEGDDRAWFEANENDATVSTMPTELFHQLLYRLFLAVTKTHHVSYCNDPKESGDGAHIELKRYNAYYTIGGNDAKRLRAAINNLSDIVSFDAENNTVSFTNEGGEGGSAGVLGKISQALMEIEGAKINRIIMAIKRYHEIHPAHKICICVNYKRSITRLVAAFKEDKPLVIHGGSSLDQRAHAIRSFAEASMKSPYLLIGNTQVLCTGIDLDDKVGNRPRFCIVSPNYSGITLYQLSHRFHRQDSKSDAVVHMMYSRGKTYEVRILDALSRKGSIMKGITQEQHNVLKYPCDYEELVVDEDDPYAPTSESEAEAEDDDEEEEEEEEDQEEGEEVGAPVAGAPPPSEEDALPVFRLNIVKPAKPLLLSDDDDEEQRTKKEQEEAEIFDLSEALVTALQIEEKEGDDAGADGDDTAGLHRQAWQCDNHDTE